MKEDESLCDKKLVQNRDYLLLLEDVRVLPQAQLAEKLGQVWAFQRRIQAAAVAARYWWNRVHVVAAAEEMFCSYTIF